MHRKRFLETSPKIHDAREMDRSSASSVVESMMLIPTCQWPLYAPQCHQKVSGSKYKELYFGVILH